MADDYMEPSWLEWAIMHTLRYSARGYSDLVWQLFGVYENKLFFDESLAFAVAIDRLKQRGWVTLDPYTAIYSVPEANRASHE